MTRRRRQFQNAAENLRQADLDNVTHFEPRRETVGDLLRRAREGKRRELAEVASQLRIRTGYLKAIEDGRFQDLPGLTYAVGFVRTYADHLGLDDEDVVRRFRDEVAELKSQTQLIFPVVAAEGKIPRGAVLLLSAVLAAIAYGGWYYLSEREESALDLIPALPTKLQELISGDSATPSDPAPETLPETTNGGTTGESAPATPAPATTTPPTTVDPVPVAPAAPAAETPADTSSPATPATPPATDGTTTGSAAPAIPGVTSAPDAPPAPTDATAESAAAASALSGVPQSAATAPVAPTPADPAPPSVAAPNLDASGLPTVAAPAAPPAANIPGISAPSDATALPPVAEGQVFGATEGGSRIVLVARLESWIQVTDPETNALLTRVLRAGDRYYVPAQADLTLATGNAGGLDVWVDGRRAPALGPVGVVRRGIALDAGRLESGTALPE